MKRYPRRLTVFLCLLTAFSSLFMSPALADEKAKRVLILPLTIHSEKDLTFLNKGILDMMAARIGQSAKVIREETPPPGKDPVQLGRDLNADYVVTGSLTVFGNRASTDYALTAVDSGDTALLFSQFGQNSGDVLMHVNQFAAQVSHYLESLTTAAPRVAAPTAAAPAVMLPQVAIPVKPIQPMPPAVAASPRAPAAPAPAAAPVVAATAAVTKTAEPAEALWTSSPLKGTISALATGDVDGDGRPDIVFAHENRIVVEHRNGERLDRLAVFDAGKHHRILAVDAGDINGNGTAEILVTRLNAHGRLESVVLEWNGSALQAIADDQSWYFRVGNDLEKGSQLMGQRRGTPSSNDTGGLYTYTHFLPGVFELTWTGNDYQAGRRIPLPEEMTIYRFTRGDIFNDGKVRTIAYSPDDALRIYDPAGTPQWAGQETLGGSPLFLENPSGTNTIAKDRTYLTQRLLVADLDDDGTVEVVTVHNRDAARGFVERFRKYTR
ncbi:MAG: VCBS repeat-containing protein, partial [Desulfobacteraceae bacterium]|nr:VCBS repeat-containing protein [Desulfobacteraceae bacterium]